MSQKIDYLDIIEGQHENKQDSNEKTKESWVELEEEKTSKSDIGKVPSCLPLDPLYVQENNQQKEQGMHFMEEEDIQDDPDQQMDQGHQNYIEIWF